MTRGLTNLLQCLALGLWEEEVGNDSVGDVGSDKDEKVFPSEVTESVWCDLTDNDIVQPVCSCRGGGTERSLVHGEDFRLVNPRN